MIELSRCSPDQMEGGLFNDAFQHIEWRSSGLWTVEGIKGRIERGEWQLWAFHHDGTMFAVAGSCLSVGDNGQKYAEILFCAGAGRHAWQDKISEFEDWARAEGCTRVRSVARLGWARTLPGYRITHAFIEKGLS